MPLRDLSNVIDLPVITNLECDPDRILQRALEDQEFQTVIIIGRDLEGKLYFATSLGDMAEVLWEMESTKHWMLSASAKD
jgi:hypothetical protein